MNKLFAPGKSTGVHTFFIEQNKQLTDKIKPVYFCIGREKCSGTYGKTH